MDNFSRIGNFHKTLDHNEFGEVNEKDYAIFERTCLALDAGAETDFTLVPSGTYPKVSAAKFTNPLAGAATESLGPDPKSLSMLPPPGIYSLGTAAELVELYWMALLRDVPLINFDKTADVATAINEINSAYTHALTSDKSVGGLKLGLDLPQDRFGNLDIRFETLFRSGLEGEEYGPLICQFMLQDIPYGVQKIQLDQFPYKQGMDFLIEYEDWIRAQNTGKDVFNRDYGICNFYDDNHDYYESTRRKISTMRDFARFVNRDALHQAYFNAALFLDAIQAPLDDGNPYKGGRYPREGRFGTLGGPDLLTLVSEVSSRALKVVWRQKWLVYRRCRPEAYAGLLQMQIHSYKAGKTKRPYGLPEYAANSKAGQRIFSGKKNNLFLPMAFSAGSPSHPSYGAGHATVAGACVTVLKAWFDESASLKEILKNVNTKKKEPDDIMGLLQPGLPLPKANDKEDTKYGPPTEYNGLDDDLITVGGELNKLASNVSMGRSMGGVHFRSDNTRSLRLGEQVAIEILRKRTMEYAETPVSFTFRAFDRHRVHITRGQVLIIND